MAQQDVWTEDKYMGIYMAQQDVWTKDKYMGIFQQGTLHISSHFDDSGLPFLTHAKDKNMKLRQNEML